MGIEARARSLGRSAAIRVLRAARQLQSKSNLLLLVEAKKKKKDEEERSEKTRMSAAVGAEKTVCVTGASGCIASWLVKLLLQRGCTLHNDPKKAEHQLAPHAAKERLQLFKSSLLERGSFDPIVEGCAGVFHTASPFYHDVKDPQAELLDPAAKGGTLNVLRSCSKTPSVQRVVLTLSMAALEDDGILRTPDVEVDEDWFCNSDLLRENNMWYELYKTLAEEAAWKFVKEQGNSATFNISAAAIANLINGAPTFPDESCGWVDVKDIANAHTPAFEVPSARGRYCLVECVPRYNDEPYTPVYWVSMEKVKSLGIDYVPLERSPKETVESLKEKGFVKF